METETNHFSNSFTINGITFVNDFTGFSKPLDQDFSLLERKFRGSTHNNSNLINETKEVSFGEDEFKDQIMPILPD